MVGKSGKSLAPISVPTANLHSPRMRRRLHFRELTFGAATAWEDGHGTIGTSTPLVSTAVTYNVEQMGITTGLGGVAFSADSHQVHFTADESRSSDSKQTLFTVDLERSAVVATKPAKPGDYYAWCTDVDTNKNGEMVFISDRIAPFRYDVVFGQPNGPQEPLGVTTVSRYNQNPVLTNDGRVLFLAGTGWNSGSRPIFSLWSVNSDGTEPKQLAGSALFTKPLEWAQQQVTAEP